MVQRIFHKISDFFALLAKIVVVPASCGFFICMIWNVMGRFLFNASFVAVEDYSKTCFVWTCFLGASLVFKDKTNIAITAVVDHLPAKLRNVLGILIDLISLVCLVLIFIYGLNLTIATRKTLMIASQMSQAVLYSALPIGAALIIIHSVSILIDKFALILAGKGAKE